MSPASELARLYDVHAPALFAFLRDFARNEADTHGLLQDIFVRMAQRDDLLAGVRSERGFLLRLARNLAIDSMRRRAVLVRNHKTFSAAAGRRVAEVNPDQGILEAALSAALQTLPEDQRAVVHLKLGALFTVRELPDHAGWFSRRLAGRPGDRCTASLRAPP